jgi:hypothetical protein
MSFFPFWGWVLDGGCGKCVGAQVLNLVEQLCLALNDEFQQYLPELLPRCIAVLTDAERTGVYTKVPAVLHTFEVLGGMFPFLLLCYKSSCFLSVSGTFALIC